MEPGSEGTRSVRIVAVGYSATSSQHEQLSPSVLPLSAIEAQTAVVLAAHDVDATLLLVGCKRPVALRATRKLFSVFEGMPGSGNLVTNRHIALFQSKRALVHALLCALREVSSPHPGRQVSLPTKEEIELSLAFSAKNEQFLILLGGTSGSGKSTLASLLAYRLGNSLASVLSTDSVRHSMRSSLPNPDVALQSSTYEVGSVTVGFTRGAQSASQKNSAIIQGFLAQSQLVMNMTADIIQQRVVRQKESLIVEGVHLTVESMLALMHKLHTAGVCVIPFLVWIESEEKHMRRFAIRGKYMALQTGENKYVRNHKNIRVIQGYLGKRADKAGVPKLNNSNMDRSLSSLHMTIFKALERWSAGDTLFDAQRQTCNFVLTQPMSSKESLQSIQAKKKRRHSTSSAPFVFEPADQTERMVQPLVASAVQRVASEAVEKTGNSADVSPRRYSLQMRPARKDKESEEEPFSCPSVGSDGNSDDGAAHWWAK